MLFFHQSTQFFWFLWIDFWSCFSFVFPIIFKLGDCPPQTFLDQFHIIVHPSPLHLILENRIPEYFFFGESDSNKIAKWVKRISNALQSYFSLSAFLLGNSHTRSDTSHCSVFCLHSRTLQVFYNYYPHFILPIMKQVRNSTKGTLLEYKIQTPLRSDLVLCWGDILSGLSPPDTALRCHLLPLFCPLRCQQCSIGPFFHLVLWVKIQIT